MKCERYDRNDPKRVCGCELPCPYHTVKFELSEDPPFIKIPLTPKQTGDEEFMETLLEMCNTIIGGSPV